MAPPKVGAPSQTTQKTHSSHRSPQETTEAGGGIYTERGNHRCRHNSLTAGRTSEHHTGRGRREGPDDGQGWILTHTTVHRATNHSTTGNPQQPSRAEAVHRMNGGDSERTESDGPRPQPMVGSTQQEEVQIEDITGKPESGGEDREPEVGTSSAPVKRKGKQPIARSPCKHPDASIVLPHSRGVQAMPNLLGCMERIDTQTMMCLTPTNSQNLHSRCTWRA
jgi:hypothetical protein